MLLKIINKQKLAGLVVGTGLAASIQLALIPPVISFYESVIIVYFLTGFFSGYISSKILWHWGIWLTFPWIIWIFFKIASGGFMDSISESLGWLIFYSFPVLPACAGTFVGGIVSRWKNFLNYY